jgi:hypothetical protein
MATQPAYGLNWPTGEKNLMIVSVGTGAAPSEGVYSNLLDTLKELPGNLMYAMQVDQDINCRTVGRCVYGAPIDRELRDMIPMDANGNILDLETDTNRHFCYMRYNADLSEKGLSDLGLAGMDSDEVREMDAVKNIQKLQKIGKAAGKQQVSVKEHFTGFL